VPIYGRKVKILSILRGNKMGFINRKTVDIVLDLGKAGAVFISGSIIIHLLVMSIDYYLLFKPLDLELDKNFEESIFSAPMIPMMVAYGILSLVIFLLWRRKKKAMLLAYEKEMQNEKIEAVFKSMQRITGILAEHIAFYNAEIMSWVESRKTNGGQVSEKVEKSSRKIAHSLQSLSRISFIIPYTENRPKNVGDIEKILQAKLSGITELQDG
jgi:hypothetical protein